MKIEVLQVQGIGNLIKKSTFGLRRDKGHGFIGVEWKLEA